MLKHVFCQRIDNGNILVMQPQSSKNAGNATCEVSLNADVARLLRKTGRWRGKKEPDNFLVAP